MNDKQFRMLELLDRQIQKCTLCGLWKNGRAKPYWTRDSDLVLVGEAPGKDEVDNNEPFVGKAGHILWNKMLENGLYKKQFLVINTTNCRPMIGNKNGKPTIDEMTTCGKWVRKYILTLDPKKIILLGAYAVEAMLYKKEPVIANSGKEDTLVYLNPQKEYRVMKSIHPASLIYSPVNVEILNESIKKFAKL